MPVKEPWMETPLLLHPANHPPRNISLKKKTAKLGTPKAKVEAKPLGGVDLEGEDLVGQIRVEIVVILQMEGEEVASVESTSTSTLAVT